MVFKNIILQKKERMATLLINRPQVMNALNQETLTELEIAVKDIEQDNNIDVWILTGAGEKSFVAGADIAQMQSFSATQARQFSLLGQKVFHQIESMEKPVIAAINGFCLGGGCELAMCCDIRIGSQTAKFGLPEVGLGVVPGFGGTQRLPRLVGLGMAKWLIYTGEVISAKQAENIGLIDKVVAWEELSNAATELAHKILKNGQWAVGSCKTAINEGMQTDINRGMVMENNFFALSFATEDQKEGMAAFVEKRKAQFKGK